MTDVAATGAVASDVSASANTYIAPAAPVFTMPAYYPVAYPSYGWPAWWGPSVSLSFGYWGGCCYGGGHHGYWGHGYRGGWGGHGAGVATDTPGVPWAAAITGVVAEATGMRIER
ncbi:hypothetical protein [Paraburkholderia podalyriae]|nr:hypothetical protein [Paraburkholderia podalyriae]